ncbi:hypothetical protein ABFS83_01G071400 [Erythranthe nasuta]
MELDFDKYCVIDGSPTTVLPAPRLISKAPSKKSNIGTQKFENERLSLHRNFSEISFNRYRSASCRDVKPRRSNQEVDHELLKKRGSVYQSSQEVNLRTRKTDTNVGRKKIEFSRGCDSKPSFGIIDTLCSLDEDSPLADRDRSSEVLMSELSTSSFCERFVPNKVSSSDKRGKESRNTETTNGGNNLHKSLSAKLALPHSPVRKTLDPSIRSKSHRSPLNSYNKTGSETISDKPHNAGCNNSRYEKKDNLNNLVPLSSPAHLHGLLKVENKNGVPFFEFSVKSPEDLFYVAKLWKVENALNWAYTFHSIHSRRKSNASGGWGFKDIIKEPSMIGQMLVSCYLCTELKSVGGSFKDDSMVTEFVLYDVAHSRRSVSSQDNIHSITTSPDNRHSRESVHFELPSSWPLSAAELNPELEIAAIIMRVPFEKRESLKFKSGDRRVDKASIPNLMDLCRVEGISDNSRPDGKMHVVIPAGNHGSPSSESGSPSPLLDRWRLGGGCDCGGWDMACPLDVFDNPRFRIDKGCPVTDNQQLFAQGRKENIPAFAMRAIEEGKTYQVDFHAQLSSLQAFSICVAILHAAEASIDAVGPDRRRSERESMKVFAEEEIESLIEKCKADKSKMEGVVSPLSFVTNPPFSPIARV